MPRGHRGVACACDRCAPRLLHVVLLTSVQGNYAMALRLQRTFGVLGHQYALVIVFPDELQLTVAHRCTLFDVRNPQLDAELVNAAKQDNIVAFIGIHLLRSGWYVCAALCFVCAFARSHFSISPCDQAARAATPSVRSRHGRNRCK